MAAVSVKRSIRFLWKSYQIYCESSWSWGVVSHVSALLKCMYSQLYDTLENMKLRHALEKKKKE